MKTLGIVALSALLCGAAVAQTGRSLVLADPIVPGQNARLDLRYPPSAVYNLYAYLISLSPMQGSVPFTLPGFTVLGNAMINPATALPLRSGQLPNASSVSYTLSLPSHPAWVGLAMDLQGVDLSIPTNTLTFTDNDVLAAVQSQSWRPTTTLSTVQQLNQPPRLVVLPQGGAVAAWLEQGGGIFPAASRYAPATGWSAPLQIGGAGLATALDIACDPNGNVTAVWRDGFDRSIYAADLPANGSWTTPVLLEQGAGDAYDPKVAVDAAGNATAVWTQWDGAFNTGALSVFAARKAVGQPWGAPLTLESSSQGDGSYAAIACNAAGAAVVTWRWDYPQNSVWRSTVMSNRYVPASGWNGELPVTADDSIGQTPPQVAIDAAGNAVVAWEAYATGNPQREVHAALSQGAGFGPTQRLDPVGSGASDTPKVVTTGIGTAIAVWSELDVSYRVMVSRLSNGSWSPAEVAVDALGVWARYPEVAADGNGRITIAYLHGTPPSLHYGYATQFVAGLGWLTPYRIDDDNHSGVLASSPIGSDGQGNVLAAIGEAWVGGTYKVVAREFR